MKTMPSWFRTWENTGLIAWYDHNHDGKIQHAAGRAFAGGKPVFDRDARGELGRRLVPNPSPGDVAEGAPFANEVYVDRDIMVLANPEIAGLPDWVIALIAAGACRGSVHRRWAVTGHFRRRFPRHLKKHLREKPADKQELTAGRIAAAVSIAIAGYLGSNPPAFVAQVVAFAFGLAASSLFPVILLGIFSTRMNKWGAVAGMLTGLIFTMGYIIYFKGVFIDPMAENVPANWFLGISPEGIGTVGMFLNLTVALTVSQFTTPPPAKIRELVERIRMPEA